MLADGTGVSFNAFGNYIYFDIDEINKGPSISGKDLFRLDVNVTTGE
ncbi:hypothetical protein IJ707_05435 [bacterium]|nr:hypothetical protein [bacterium]